MENVAVNLSCSGDSVDVVVIRSYSEWGPSPVSRTEEHHRIACSCGIFNKFIKRLASVKPEKCESRNAYSINSDISSSIFFTDESNSLGYVSYNGRLCAFGSNEKDRSPLESIDYDLRRFITDVGAYKGLIIDRPLKTINKPDVPKYSMVSSIKNIDNRFNDEIQIFLFDQDTSAAFVENLDAFSHFRAFIEGSSVVYEFSENGKIVQKNKDTDVKMFEKMLEFMRSYKTETWKVSSDCRSPFKSLYWNERQSLNLISFRCATEKQEVWSLYKKIEDWFKLKLNYPI